MLHSIFNLNSTSHKLELCIKIAYYLTKCVYFTSLKNVPHVSLSLINALYIPHLACYDRVTQLMRSLTCHFKVYFTRLVYTLTQLTVVQSVNWKLNLFFFPLFCQNIVLVTDLDSLCQRFIVTHTFLRFGSSVFFSKISSEKKHWRHLP